MLSARTPGDSMRAQRGVPLLAGPVQPHTHLGVLKSKVVKGPSRLQRGRFHVIGVVWEHEWKRSSWGGWVGGGGWTPQNRPSGLFWTEHVCGQKEPACEDLAFVRKRADKLVCGCFDTWLLRMKGEGAMTRLVRPVAQHRRFSKALKRKPTHVRFFSLQAQFYCWSKMNQWDAFSFASSSPPKKKLKKMLPWKWLTFSPKYQFHKISLWCLLNIFFILYRVGK